MPRHPLLNFAYSLILVVITALWCSWFTRVGMENFYSYIKLPAFTPPDYVFPVAWTIIYVLLILSFDKILNLGSGKHVQLAAQLFVGNLILQILWCFVFFYNAYFLVGFAVLVLLVFMAIVLTEKFYDLQKSAGILLIPYVAWLAFAAYLNWGIADLNGAVYPF